ncbi:MAG: relaxase/mobilization nuclease domain-containing protein [Clostridia bacterium]|nr:relaxase/mobilization nuclease domain-containing protein [Clostridia bacterium]
MATVNVIPEAKQSPSAMRGLINYCLRKEKTFDVNSGRKLITGINCFGENAYAEFMTTKAVYHKETGMNFYHFSQSFSPEEKITPEQVHEVGIEFAKRAWPGHEVLVCTHMDEPHLHSNFVVNSVNFENGSKIHFTPNSLKVLRDISDEICISQGFSVLPPYEKGGRSISTREYRAAEKGQSWKFRLISDIQESMKYSGNRNQFTKEMAKRGYQMRWTDERKNITFTCPNGKLCRDIKLHDDKFLKEMIENEFKIREQLTKELLDGRINQEELFKFGRTRTTDLSSGDMFHTKGTEVNRDTTDEGYGRISAVTVRSNFEVGDERYDRRESDRPDESAIAETGGYDQLYSEKTHGDSEGCGEYFETGWEDEREFYFRVLLGNENQLRSIGGSYRYAEETSVEVPGNYDRSSNILLDAGVGTLTALASLMDNDQDDDPEEKKKKLDAKDAGSNFGFALGGAAGLIGAILTKGINQGATLRSTASDESLKANQIDEVDIDEYEEIQDNDIQLGM